MCKRLIEGPVSSSSNDANFIYFLDVYFFFFFYLSPRLILDEPVRPP